MRSRVTKKLRGLLVRLASVHDEADRDAWRYHKEDKSPHAKVGDVAHYRAGAIRALTKYIARDIAEALGDEALGQELAKLADQCDDAIDARRGGS